jgi:hypothetical protein
MDNVNEQMQISLTGNMDIPEVGEQRFTVEEYFPAIGFI